MNRRSKEYETEAQARWGDTAAFAEYVKKSALKTPDEQKSDEEGLMALFAEAGKLKDLPAGDAAVRAKVKELQSYITKHFYTCTDEILAGLGETYTADPRFRESIDRAGGEGTAAFVSAAVKIYCEKRA